MSQWSCVWCKTPVVGLILSSVFNFIQGFKNTRSNPAGCTDNLEPTYAFGTIFPFSVSSVAISQLLV